MEKRISFSNFQQVKSVAKGIDPILQEKRRIQAKIDGLDAKYKAKAEEDLVKLKQRIADSMAEERGKLQAELESKDRNISMFEAGVVNLYGFHVLDAVKKVIEPDAKGKKVTKYVATDNVSYDEQSKEYVIVLPDEEVAVVPPTTEGGPGSDYDIDAEDEDFQAGHDGVEDTDTTAEAEVGQTGSNEANGQMPWD